MSDIEHIDIRQHNGTYSVYINNVCEAKGFFSVEFALYSIWCLKGCIADHFYVVNDNMDVKKIDRGIL